MPRRSLMGAGAVLMLAMVMQALTVSTARSQPISIACARDPKCSDPDTEVTVEGSVTVPSGIFSSATFDQGFAIQDETAGIYVSVAIDLHLHLYRRVRVTGLVQDDGFGLLILRPAAPTGVVVLHGLRWVAPQEHTTCDIDNDTEGSLVRVTGKVTQPIRNDLPFGYGVFIDSSDNNSCQIQVFIHASSGINPFLIPFIQIGRRIKVTGFSGEFTNPSDPTLPNPNFEVSPRFWIDIRRAR